MTDRYDAFIIELTEPIREDDAESLLQVIRHLKGVRQVIPHVRGWENELAVDAARRDLGNKLWEVLYPGYEKRTS